MTPGRKFSTTTSASTTSLLKTACPLSLRRSKTKLRLFRFKAKNPAMGARISYWLRDYPGEEVKITITDEHDNTIRKLKGSNRPGINRAVWDLQYEKHDRYDNPESRMGQTRFVPPGEYTASIKVGDHKAKRKFTVLPSPIEHD